MTTRTLAVVSAGLQQPSATRLLADQLAAAAREELAQRDVRVRVRTVEVREHAHDVVNHALTGFPPASLKPAIDAVTGADGLIAVTPIFNASYSGLFKSFFDILERGSLLDMPVLVGATGGTARHSLALEHAVRPMFAHLRAVVTPTSVFAAPDDWAGAAVEGALRDRIRRAGRQFADQVAGRERTAPTDPFALPAPFEELLSEG